MDNKLNQIETLRRQIEAQGKLPDETLRRIEYRFRLECNYYSNRQEGGTLTRQETRSVMIGNITVNGKPWKDINEMKGHDQAMLDIMRIGRGELNISEKRIQDIHRAIIVEEDPEKQKLVGEWKHDYNEIINSNGEKFGFAPPVEVPELMHTLLNWLNGELEKVKRGDKNAIHPAVLAFEFHHRFLSIHPFYDGNGRTARLLSNLILVANGYPPFYITDEEKENYYRYLSDIQGYGGDPDLFIEFMLGLLERSLQITLEVIEGREVEDEDDWVKKLRLLKTNLSVDQDVKAERSFKSVKAILTDSILPLSQSLLTNLKEFDELFARKKVTFWRDNNGKEIKMTKLGLQGFDRMENTSQIPRELKITYQLDGFKKAGTNTFSASISLHWLLEDFKYTLTLEFNRPEFQLSKLYDQFYTPEDLKTITARCGEALFQQIERNLQKQ